MQVYSTRELSGTMEELIREFEVIGNDGYLDSQIVIAIMKDQGNTKVFQIPAVDGIFHLTFNNREMLSRFSSLPIDCQKKFLTCIRNAMNKKQLFNISIVGAWSSAGSRSIDVRQDISVLVDNNLIFGQGPLIFSS